MDCWDIMRVSTLALFLNTIDVSKDSMSCSRQEGCIAFTSKRHVNLHLNITKPPFESHAVIKGKRKGVPNEH